VRVAVVHNSLDSAGGGERLCLRTIHALQNAGHEVLLATVEPTDWDRVERIMGETVRPDAEFSLLPFKLRLFGIYLRLLTTFPASSVRKQYDLLINTHGDVLPISADITCMHYPTFALVKETPANQVREKSFLASIFCSV
jgi:hypothetical protein